MLKSAGLACLDFSPTMQILKIFIREKMLKERLIICSPVFQKQNRPEHRRWAGRAALVHRCSLHAGHASADHSTLWCTATSRHLGANLHPPPGGGRSSNKMTWGMLAGLYSKSFSYIHRACEGNFCPFFWYLSQQSPADQVGSPLTVSGVPPWQRVEWDSQQIHVNVLRMEWIIKIRKTLNCRT